AVYYCARGVGSFY
nr:immunoglobulin heavy chain junction region [Mus musculus]